MKKIYAVFKSTMLLVAPLMLLMASKPVHAQICGPIVEDFNTESNNTAGFTGDFSYDMTNHRLLRQNVIATAVYSITTPTYVLPSSASSMGFGFVLDGTEQVARAEVVVMYVSTLTNQMTTIFLAQFVPNYGAGSVASPCRGVDLSDLPGFPSGGLYRFRIDLTSSSGSGLAGQTITFDDFKTNGVKSLIGLPVNFIGFEAKKVAGTVQLKWKVAGEENVDRYEVERSEDGRTFTTVGSVPHSGKDTYTFSDANNSSTVYYRVRNVDNDRKYKYSTIARIANGKSDIVIKAFPQPVKNQLVVQHPSIAEKALITLSTADGRIVRTITPAAGSMQTYVDMSSLNGGLYMLRFDSGNGETQTMKIIKQ